MIDFLFADRLTPEKKRVVMAIMIEIRSKVLDHYYFLISMGMDLDTVNDKTDRFRQELIYDIAKMSVEEQVELNLTTEAEYAESLVDTYYSINNTFKTFNSFLSNN